MTSVFDDFKKANFARDKTYRINQFQNTFVYLDRLWEISVSQLLLNVSMYIEIFTKWLNWIVEE